MASFSIGLLGRLGAKIFLDLSVQTLTLNYYLLLFEFISVSVTGVTAFLIIMFHGNVSAAACGLALSYAAQLSGVFQLTVRQASDTEAKFVSVERFRDFLKFSVSEEEDCDYSATHDEITKKNELGNNSYTLIPRQVDAPRSDWPYEGNVKFQDVTVQYEDDSLPALKEVSFEVRAGQKIGKVKLISN